MIDDRITCIDCRHLDKTGHCAKWREVGASRTYRPVPDLWRRCFWFEPEPDLADQRIGEERWPWLRGEFA